MEGNPKQAIAQRIKEATNILVTVSRDPSVDELAAALGFTLMLNKMDKHATAVFSGQIPSAINFLEPDKTFESTVDSLRDFIIALDKEKADRLRYKVEDDVVRIFITPYRTNITSGDLEFSQGDFNVELIIALGVDRREDLDTAITAHGRILHDSTVVTINANDDKNSLGSIDWSDSSASSLCEMLMSLSEALQSGLLDEQIASSLLTGIVASTERFSNTKTSPKVMTMAAQLMAAGANQQLIAARLEEGNALPSSRPAEEQERSSLNGDGTTSLQEGSSARLQKELPEETPAEPAAPPRSDGELHVQHDEKPAEKRAEPEVPSETEAPEPAEPSFDLPPPPPQPSANLSVEDLRRDLEEASREVEAAADAPVAGAPAEGSTEPAIGKAKGSDWRNKIVEPPSLGGTLNATTSQAEEERLEEDRENRNRTILSHESPADAGSQAVSGASEEPRSVDPFADPMSYEETPPPENGYISTKARTIMPIGSEPQEEQTVPEPASEQAEASVEAPAPERPADAAPTLAELEEQAKSAAAARETGDSLPPAMSVDDARAAVDAALSATPSAPNPAFPLPSEEASVAPSPIQPPMPPLPGAEPTLPPPPPMPSDLSGMPPLPPMPGEPAPQPHPGMPPLPQFPQPPQEESSSDPGQFQIPGQ